LRRSRDARRDAHRTRREGRQPRPDRPQRRGGAAHAPHLAGGDRRVDEARRGRHRRRPGRDRRPPPHRRRREAPRPGRHHGRRPRRRDDVREPGAAARRAGPHRGRAVAPAGAPEAGAGAREEARESGGGRVPEPILNVQQIEKLLPHRYPFLLVDRVIELEQGKRIVALKCVTMNEPFFTGHFPGTPVMPGVLIIEALAQTAALLALVGMTEEERKGKVTYFMGIDGARFRKPVVPGDRLELSVEVVKAKGAVLKVKGEAKVDGQVVAEAEIMAMLANAGG